MAREAYQLFISLHTRACAYDRSLDTVRSTIAVVLRERTFIECLLHRISGPLLLVFPVTAAHAH